MLRRNWALAVLQPFHGDHIRRREWRKKGLSKKCPEKVR
jgi:hypothetical protein